MSRRNAWTAGLLAVATVAAIFWPRPADAAASRPEPPPSGKSFAWTFTGTCCITSRPFTTTVRAPITVTSVLVPCETNLGRIEYAIGLWRGGVFVGAKPLTCWGSAAWKDSQVFVGYGSVFYDGARS